MLKLHVNIDFSVFSCSPCLLLHFLKEKKRQKVALHLSAENAFECFCNVDIDVMQGKQCEVTPH